MDVSHVSAAIATVALTYSFLWNFKKDVNTKFDKLEIHLTKLEMRLDKQDDRMFLIMTGKKLSDVILEQKKEKKRKGK